MSQKININESFPNLGDNAPIVEAIIACRIFPKIDFSEEFIAELKQEFNEFEKIESIKSQEFKIDLKDDGKSSHVLKRGLIGLKLTDKDSAYILQLQNDKVVFSRLPPYNNWLEFSTKAIELIEKYLEVSKRKEITRIGVRFINNIVADKESLVEDYFRDPPKTINEVNWPIKGFLHHNVVRIPNTDYGATIIKTIQNVPSNIRIGYLLDIDVYIEKKIDYDVEKVKGNLQEMSWIKNKIFYTSITEEKIEELKPE